MKADTAAKPTEGVGAELYAYVTEPILDESTDPLLYWKLNATKYPSLCKVALEYLTIQASSAAVERIFSIAGKIFKPDWCRMTDVQFERMMFIKCNSK